MKGEDLMKLDLINGKPGRSMFLFALPMIIGNLFQQFYNMADSVIVGNLVGEEALAAVGASYSFTTVFIMVAIGSGMGASVLASQYLGAKKYREMKTSIYTFLIAFGIFSVLMALLGFFVNPAILRALKTPDNIFADAVLYLQIYFAGLPFMFMYNILSANFNALGKSQIPLMLLIFSSVLNVVLDLWMVAGLQLGVAGVAIATVIAQGVSSVISFVILMRLLKEYETEGAVKKFDSGMFAGGVRIAVPSIIQQSIVSIGMLLTQSAVNQFGSSAVAGYSAGMRLESVCVVPMIASGNAMSTFTAQNLGAGNKKRVGEGYRAAFRIVIGFGAGLILISQFFYGPIISMFVSAAESPEAFSTGTAYLKFTGWFFAFLGFKSVTDGVLRGAGDVKVYMIANLINLGIRVSVAQLCSPVFGIQFVWYAVPLGWFVNFAISYLWYRTGNWKKKKLIES
ncbi:MATE family efflux transporter [Schaedlerella arabinosiphila]|uniref:MATE family efflux transporter n=1 Tax=Schaedlerella arabinosiphila TaxID=2044587 RepID=UPI002557F740|nr:MATE family efflux transporter [Schaedlerella arabinosiphila]